jgi:hypothetical protein
MSTKYNDNYRKFIEESFTNKQEISELEYNALPVNERLRKPEDGTGENIKYYKLTIDDFNNDEFNQAIQLTLLLETKNINKKQSTIKNIMIFWLILTIINLIGLFYIINELGMLRS